MAYDGKHVRYTQIHGFPKQKYGFKFHLKNVGNFIVTMPMEWPDVKKFHDAAYQWAWQHGYRVSCTRVKVGDGLWEVKCTLISKTRIRDYG